MLVVPGLFEAQDPVGRGGPRISGAPPKLKIRIEALRQKPYISIEGNQVETAGMKETRASTRRQTRR